MVILAHIAGPTGSGKTTLGKKIKKKFPDIIVQDLDDIYQNLPLLYPKEYKKVQDNKIKRKKFYQKYIKRGYNKFLKKFKNSNIIFVGTNATSIKDDFSDQVYYDIDSKYKYFIDIDQDIILRRRFNRHIKFMLDNLDIYYNKAIKKGKLIIDIELWKKKINASYLDNYYKNKKYKFLSNDLIFKDIIKLISY